MQTAKHVKLLAKYATLKEIPSEEELMSRQRLWLTATIMMPLIGITLVVVGTLQLSNAKLSLISITTVVWISCYFIALFLALGVWPAARCARRQAQLRRYYYEEVCEGQFLGVVLADKRKDPSVIGVILQGENRVKQPRSSVADMLVKTWREKTPTYGDELVVRDGLAE